MRPSLAISRTCGCSQREIRFHAPPVEIDAGENRPAVLSQQEVQINAAGIEFDRQTAAVIHADGGPNALCGLHADPGADRVALVLRDGEAAGVGELVAGFTAQKEAAGDRPLRAGGLVRIAQEAGEAAPLGDGEANFFADDARVIKSDREADAGVQQNVVISEIPEVPAKYVGV